MSTYLTLYRKYRPQRFAEVVGQTHVTGTLQNAIAHAKLAHAYLFCGPRGTGKTTTARILATTLNCTGRSPDEVEACGECESCLDIARGVSFDVYEVDAASHRGIDDIRQISERAQQAATDPSRYTIFIIDEVHQLSRDGASAFLKTLEEPPANVVFVLATTDPDKMIPTILSRCQRFDFRPVPVHDLVARLRFVCDAEGMDVEDAALEAIARRSRGGARDALSALEQARALCGDEIGAADIVELFGGLDLEDFLPVTDAVIEADPAALLRHLDDLVSRGIDVRVFAKELADHLRNVFLAAAAPEQRELVDAGDEAFTRIAERGQRLGLARAAEALRALGEAIAAMPQSLQPRIDLELALSSLCSTGAQASRSGTTAGAPGQTAEVPSAESPPAARAPDRPRVPSPAPDPAPGPDPTQLAALIERVGHLERQVQALRAQRSAPAAAAQPDAPGAPRIPAPPRAISRPTQRTAASTAGAPAETGPPPQAPGQADDGSAPAAGAASGGTGPDAGPGGPDLGTVRDGWNQVLARMREESQRVAAYYVGSIVLGIEGGAVRVRFAHGFNRDQAAHEESRRLFAEACRVVLGVPMRLDGVVAGEGPESGPDGEGAGGGPTQVPNAAPAGESTDAAAQPPPNGAAPPAAVDPSPGRPPATDGTAGDASGTGPEAAGPGRGSGPGSTVSQAEEGAIPGAAPGDEATDPFSDDDAFAASMQESRTAESAGEELPAIVDLVASELDGQIVEERDLG